MATTFIDAEEEDRGALGTGAIVSIVLHLAVIACLFIWVHGVPSDRNAGHEKKTVTINLEMVHPPPKPAPPKPPEPPKPKPKPEPPKPAPPKPVPQPIITHAPARVQAPSVPPPPKVTQAPKSDIPPAPPAPSAPSAPPAPVVSYEVSAQFRGQVLGAVQSSLVYPDAAKAQNRSGTPVVRVRMARDGRVLEVTLVKSSGTAALDKEALDVFKRIGTLPALDASYRPDATDFVFSLPIAFVLQDLE